MKSIGESMKMEVNYCFIDTLFSFTCQQNEKTF